MADRFTPSSDGNARHAQPADAAVERNRGFAATWKAAVEGLEDLAHAATDGSFVGVLHKLAVAATLLYVGGVSQGYLTAPGPVPASMSPRDALLVAGAMLIYVALVAVDHLGKRHASRMARRENDNERIVSELNKIGGLVGIREREEVAGNRRSDAEYYLLLLSRRDELRMGIGPLFARSEYKPQDWAKIVPRVLAFETYQTFCASPEAREVALGYHKADAAWNLVVYMAGEAFDAGVNAWPTLYPAWRTTALADDKIDRRPIESPMVTLQKIHWKLEADEPKEQLYSAAYDLKSPSLAGEGGSKAELRWWEGYARKYVVPVFELEGASATGRLPRLLGFAAASYSSVSSETLDENLLRADQTLLYICRRLSELMARSGMTYDAMRAAGWSETYITNRSEPIETVESELRSITGTTIAVEPAANGAGHPPA